MKRETRRKILLYSAIVIGTIFAIIITLALLRDYSPQLHQLLDPQHDRQYLKQAFRHHGVKDAILLMVLTAILTAIPGAPVAVVCVFNGVLYGPWLGIVMNLGGYVVGNLMVVYLLSHFNFIRNSQRFQNQMKSFKRFKNPEIALILGYALPVIPSGFTNYMAVKLKMNFKRLMACILLGTFPTSILYAFGGDAVFRGSTLRIVIAVVLIVFIFAALLVVYRRFEHHHLQH